jgi:Domain of unknown function (DUF6391)
VIHTAARAAAPILNIPYVRRIRRNHGLEHATVHVLTESVKGRPLAGRSDAAGFWLFGELETEDVKVAVAAALRRMQGGEHQLAVHPGCGTARLTTGTVAGLAALSGTIGAQRSFGGMMARLPTVILLTMVGIFMAEPLGLQLQEHFTTLGDPGDLKVISVERKPGGLLGNTVLHRVTTTST